MMNLNTLKVSYHFQNDRQERKQRIDAIIDGNLGSAIFEEWYKDAWRVLTDTGLIVIVERNKELILTYYFATMRQVNNMYHCNGRKTPQAIINKVQKNVNAYNRLYNESLSKKVA